MPGHRSRSARLLGLLAAAALATAGLLLVLASQDGPESSGAPVVAQRPGPAEARSPEWRPPVLPPVLPIDVPEVPVASPEAAVGAAPLADRIELTIERMAASLRDGPVDRSSWETEIRALTGSLGPESIPGLLELAADTSLPDEQLVAVAELLRPWSAAPGGLPAPLPEPALAALRRSLDERPRRPVATAAARALGALGERSDTARLLDELVDPASRSLASWGLQASPSVTLLDDLRGLLATDIDAESKLVVLTTMEGWARSAAPGFVAGSSRDATASTLAAFLEEASLEPALRQRAASALVAIGGASARNAVEKICRDPASDDGLIRVGVSALAADADPAAMALLEDGLWNEASPDARRLEFAAGLARISAPSSSRPALLEIAFASERPADQRRALYSLGALPPGSDTVAAAATALGDRDPAVRAAGIWVLDRTALAPACADQLRWLSETDSSEGVRRSASRALERLESEFSGASP
jgi:hypothetical protein